LLFREGRGYWVRWLDGVWQVVDLEDAQQGPLGPLLQSVLAEAGPLGPVSFRLAGTTGAQEQIAGLAGRVYNATGQLPDGTQVAETVVLATDPDMQHVQRTLVGICAAMVACWAWDRLICRPSWSGTAAGAAALWQGDQAGAAFEGADRRGAPGIARCAPAVADSVARRAMT